MAHISDLPAPVLARIISKAADTPALTLSQWKTKLPILAVCRAWTKQAIGAVFNQVYVEVTALPLSSLIARPLCTSNAELFISRGCVLAARRLTIEWLLQTTPDHLHFIVLEVLKLDRVDWQNINSLIFTEAAQIFQRPVEPIIYDKRAVTDIARTLQYFAQNVRNIFELDMSIQNYGATEECLYDNLVTYYGPQLQILRARYSIPLQSPYFSRNIKVLELHLDSAAACILPNISGETLRVLKLDHVPRNFAWNYFRYNLFVLPIVFYQLTILHLTFEYEDTPLTEALVQDKIGWDVHNCDQLSFPALRELSIENCTPNCDLLYADFPFPELNRVHLSGSISSLRQCSRLKLTWVGDLEIWVGISESDSMVDIYGVISHFFSDICIGRTASLCVIGDWRILNPELICWANLTKLEVDGVEYATLCKAIGRLPNLCQLTINCLELGDIATDSLSADSPLFINADPIMSWGKKLAALSIRAFDKDYPLATGISDIQALILHSCALKELSVPRSTKQRIIRCIDAYKDRYPHWANIRLHFY